MKAYTRTACHVRDKVAYHIWLTDYWYYILSMYKVHGLGARDLLSHCSAELHLVSRADPRGLI